MLQSITVTNYRGFKERTELQLRPITVLLGRNSSGKSSLTRLVPLIQQSLERQSSSPILWASDAVDLGNILDVLNHDAGDEPLRIGFRLTDTDIYGPLHQKRTGWRTDSQLQEVFYEVRLRPDGIRTRFEGFDLTIADQCMTVDWNEAGFIQAISVNGVCYPIEKEAYLVVSTSLFPTVISRLAVEDVGRTIRNPMFYPPLRDRIYELVHQKTGIEKIDYFARRFPYTPRAQIHKSLSDFPNVVEKRLSTDAVNLVSDVSFINDMPSIINQVGAQIKAVFQSSAYIGPSRTSAARFNRIQELAVSRIDSFGLNTAMYLYSLNESELISFNDLLMRASGHMVGIEESGHGHVSIKVGRFGQPHFENLADVGFGFSQIIPVVAQLHAVQNRPATSEFGYADQAVFSVEQPELHLHPALQSNLADLFAGVAGTDSFLVDDIRVLIETHSETMISQLGLLVSTGELVPEDVAVYFVEKDEFSNTASLHRAHFDEDGVIKDWPLGFFSPN